MESYAEKLGIQLSQFYEHIVFIHMEKDGFPIKIHSNIVIQDGIRCVRSSSNLTDRSLGSLPCDTELGIVVTDVASIQKLQQTLWKRYCLLDDPLVTLTHLEFFSRAWSGQGLLRNVMNHALPSLFSVDYLAFLMSLLHDEPLFGNNKKIRWSVKKPKR
jgi:phosphatidylserine/phosphatidylglycerophosphate/cardiolipin synthase-like enzyme